MSLITRQKARPQSVLQSVSRYVIGRSLFTITTRLVDTVSTPMLLKVVQAKKIDPTLLITHRFRLEQIDATCETFTHAADTGALKVITEA